MSITEALNTLAEITPEKVARLIADLDREQEQAVAAIDKKRQLLQRLFSPVKPKPGPLPLENKAARVHPPLKVNEVVAPAVQLVDQVYAVIDGLGPRTIEQLTGDLGHRTSSKIGPVLENGPFIAIEGDRWQIKSKVMG